LLSRISKEKPLMIFLKERKGVSILLIVIIAIAAIVIVVASAIILLGNMLPSSETIIGSGNLITQQKDFVDFSAIEVSNAFHVEISQSSFYSISVTADDNVIDYVEVSKTGNALNVGMKIGSFQSTTLHVEIEMPEIDSLVLSGATKGAIKDFSSSEPFFVELSGASSLEMADMDVGDFDVEISGASTLTAEGSGNNLLSIVSGSSNMDLTNFAVTNGELSISGASQATVNLDGTLDAVVSGVSTLYYIGEPTMGDIDISDTSTINRK
jgi:hypothetical protein